MEREYQTKRKESGEGHRSEEEHQSETTPRDERIKLTKYRAAMLHTAELFYILAALSIYLLYFLTKASLDISIASCCILYVLARLYLVVISFINLAFLPDSAYTLVQWARYVPHIG